MLRRLLRERLERRLNAPRIPLALERLSRAGFAPRSILDVGAHEGEFARTCEARWPDAAVTCVEPLPAACARLRALAAARPRWRVVESAAGASEGTGSLSQADTASSLLPEHHEQGFAHLACTVRTVDDIVEREGAGRAPDLLKIDVQGFTLPVLRGAERTLPRIGAVLAELDLIDIHRGAELAGEVIAWLGARDFVLFDVCGLTRRPLDDALWQLDGLFVHRTSALRADRRWR